VAGKDASKQFWKYHNESILKKYKSQLQIGSLDSKKVTAPSTPISTAPDPTPTTKLNDSGDVKPARSESALEVYGDLVPFADPAWYQGVSQPASIHLLNRTQTCL
jgi:hypothetical protein